MFKSATVTLMLWYVLLSLGLSLLFSGVLYHFSTRELAEALHNQYQVLAINDGDSRLDTSSQELDTRSQHLLLNLVYFNTLVLVGSSVASYGLARRTLRPIEVAHQAQIRFTAEASHELRTPLAAMKADTETTLMEQTDDPAVLRRTLQDNLNDIAKLEKLTDHLLELSRYKSQAAVVRETIDLEGIIRDVAKQFQQPISAKQLKIRTNTLPLQVTGDQQAVRQLITIVLDNAIKYSQPKGVIALSLSKDNRHAVIKIADEGIGIRVEDLDHVFESFYRAQNVSTKGYGLGLPLAKGIVEAHGGTIAIQSQPPAGTVVTVKLPLS